MKNTGTLPIIIKPDMLKFTITRFIGFFRLLCLKYIIKNSSFYNITLWIPGVKKNYQTIENDCNKTNKSIENRDNEQHVSWRVGEICPITRNNLDKKLMVFKNFISAHNRIDNNIIQTQSEKFVSNEWFLKGFRHL